MHVYIKRYNILKHGADPAAFKPGTREFLVISWFLVEEWIPF